MLKMTFFRKIHSFKALSCALCLGLSACVSAPPAPLNSSNTREAVAAPDWWQSFDDPILARLIETSLRQNYDLAASTAGIDALEALARQAGIDLTPTTSTTAEIELGRAAGQNQSTDTFARIRPVLSWEADLFGRLRAARRAARYDLTSSIEGRRDLAVIIASQTGLAYTAFQGASVRIEVAKKSAALQEESVQLVETLLENGRGSDLDLQRARAQYRSTLASIPLLEAARDNAMTQLAALTALPRQDLIVLIETTGADQNPIPQLQRPLPDSDMEAYIRRRPDVRQAEAELGSFAALEDVSRADLFPVISVNANVLSLLDLPDDTIEVNTLGFGVGPSISWAGPDLRSARARIDVANARARQAAALYEQAVLNALRDTESALTDYLAEIKRRDDLEKAVRASRNALNLATLRYNEGLDDYLEVLDAQRTLLASEDRLAINEIAITQTAISVYRNLGGVWSHTELSSFLKTADK